MRCGHSFPLWIIFLLLCWLFLWLLCRFLTLLFFDFCAGSFFTLFVFFALSWFFLFSWTLLVFHVIFFEFWVLFHSSLALEFVLWFLFDILAQSKYMILCSTAVPIDNTYQHQPSWSEKNMNRWQKTPNNVTVWRVDTQTACARSISSTTMRNLLATSFYKISVSGPPGLQDLPKICRI